MATIWRAKCRHHDVRVDDAYNPPAGRHADGKPRWSACMYCCAEWVRYEVTESVVWFRCFVENGKATRVRVDERGAETLKAGGHDVVRVTRRHLRRCRS